MNPKVRIETNDAAITDLMQEVADAKKRELEAIAHKCEGRSSSEVRQLLVDDGFTVEDGLDALVELLASGNDEV